LKIEDAERELKIQLVIKTQRFLAAGVSKKASALLSEESLWEN